MRNLNIKANQYHHNYIIDGRVVTVVSDKPVTSFKSYQTAVKMAKGEA